MVHQLPRSQTVRILATSLVVILLAGVTGMALAAATSSTVTFSDVEKQTREFIGYNDSIQLTAAQEAIKKEALQAIPAPCCSDNTAYTCCCPCNMAKSIWGLSAYLIAKQGMAADAVRTKVKEWIDFINPAGFSGDVCHTAGGCTRAFKSNGCGGMHPSQLVF
jgi:hypothetical protein